MPERPWKTLLLLLLILPVPAPAAKGGGDLPFLRTELSDSTPFSGQEVELSYTLFFNGMAPKISDAEKPVHRELWIEDHTPEGLIPSRPREIDGKLWRSAVIKRMKLVPLRSGTLDVTGYRLLCEIPGDIPPGATAVEDDTLTISAPDVTLEVRPLPEPVPETFSGAVGRFGVEAFLERDTVQAGETLGLTFVISGKGSFRTLPEFGLSLPEGLRETGTRSSAKAESARGEEGESLTKTALLQAAVPGTRTFSPISFTAFDPWSETYSSVTTKQLTLTVLPPVEGGDTAAAVPVEGLNATGRKSHPAPLVPGPVLFLALPALVLAALLFYFLAKKKPSHRPKEGSPEKLRGENISLQSLRSDIESAVEAACGVHPRGMTRQELKNKLRERGAGAEVPQRLVELLDRIDRLDFAPGEPSAADLASLRQSARSITASLRR